MKTHSLNSAYLILLIIHQLITSICLFNMIVTTSWWKFPHQVTELCLTSSSEERKHQWRKSEWGKTEGLCFLNCGTLVVSHSWCSGCFPGLRKRRRLLLIVINSGSVGLNLCSSSRAGLRVSVVGLGGSETLLAVLFGAVLARAGVAGLLWLALLMRLSTRRLTVLLLLLLLLGMLVLLLLRIGPIQTKFLLILLPHAIFHFGPDETSNDHDNQQYDNTCSAAHNNPAIYSPYFFRKCIALRRKDKERKLIRHQFNVFYLNNWFY